VTFKRDTEFQAAETAEILWGNIQIWMIKFNPADAVRGWSSEGRRFAGALSRSAERTAYTRSLAQPPGCTCLGGGPGRSAHPRRGAGCPRLRIPQGGLWEKKNNPGFPNITLGLFHFYVVLGS